jgi:DNA (cytosine-5)-methyltransferase 1
MKALDLFCGGGGAGVGLHRAGFDVTGVDVVPQPEYPLRFFLGDALRFPLEGYDLVWASPPCQAHTTLRGLGKAREDDAELIIRLRRRLRRARVPYVIENVVGAPLLNPVVLCGSMFGLAVRRHRLFECSFPVRRPMLCSCRARRNVAVYGKAPGHRLPDGVQRARSVEHGRDAMGINWLSWRPLTQAIPPAYSEYIGRAFMSWHAAHGAKFAHGSVPQVEG